MAEDQMQMLEVMIKAQMIVPGKVRVVDLEGEGTVALEIDGEHYMPVLEWMRRKRTHDRSTGYSWVGDPASDAMIRARDVVEEVTITRRPLTAAEQAAREADDEEDPR